MQPDSQDIETHPTNAQNAQPIQQSHRAPNSRESLARLIALFVIALALRLTFCAMTPGLGRSFPVDYREYMTCAHRLLTHGTITSPLILNDADQTPSDLMPPAYVLLVAGVYRLFGVESFASTLTLQIINATATSVIVLLVFATTDQLFNRKAAWIAAAIASVDPLLIRYTGFIWDTALFSLGVALVVWQATRLARQSNPWHRWLTFGLALGAIALLNPALTIAYPLLVLWPATARRDRSSLGWLKPAVLTTVGWIIVVAPWSLRNLMSVGEFSYVRGGFMLELWRGFCPQAEQGTAAAFKSAFPLKNPQAQQRVVELGESAYIDECGQRAIAAIRADPIRAARLVARRFIDYWFAQVVTDLTGDDTVRTRSRLETAAKAFIILESLLLLTMLLPKCRQPDTLWLLGIVLAFSLVYCLTNVQMRFRAPAEPLMAIIVAGILCQKRSPSRQTPTAPNGTAAP